MSPNTHTSKLCTKCLKPSESHLSNQVHKRLTGHLSHDTPLITLNVHLKSSHITYIMHWPSQNFKGRSHNLLDSNDNQSLSGAPDNGLVCLPCCDGPVCVYWCVCVYWRVCIYWCVYWRVWHLFNIPNLIAIKGKEKPVRVGLTLFSIMSIFFFLLPKVTELNSQVNVKLGWIEKKKVEIHWNLMIEKKKDLTHREGGGMILIKLNATYNYSISVGNSKRNVLCLIWEGESIHYLNILTHTHTHTHTHTTSLTLANLPKPFMCELMWKVNLLVN